jgi:superfamily II DNA helicase RecQ
MPFRIITVPFDPGTGCLVEEELNRFCLNKRIVSSRAEFFTRHDGVYWTVFLEYEQVVENSSATDDFTDAQRLLFTRIREWRKGKAEELGVPVYVIRTNAQATEVVKRAPRTLE